MRPIDQKRLGFPGTGFDLILPLFDLGTNYLFLDLLSVGGGGHEWRKHTKELINWYVWKAGNR